MNITCADIEEFINILCEKKIDNLTVTVGDIIMLFKKDNIEDYRSDVSFFVRYHSKDLRPKGKTINDIFTKNILSIYYWFKIRNYDIIIKPKPGINLFRKCYIKICIKFYTKILNMEVKTR